MRRLRILAVSAAAALLFGCAKEAPLQTMPVQTTVPPTTEMATVPPLETTVPIWTEPADPSEFVRIVDYVPNARQELPYATADNFTGQVVYDFDQAYLRYGTTLKLAAAAAELEKLGFGLLIWDGFRPVDAQARFYEVFPDPAYVSPPGVGQQNHCRGRAVDLTLYDLQTGELLEMPSAFDEFSALADRSYGDVSEQAAENSRILEEVMERHGFVGYSGEWWHYTDMDDYPVDGSFDPADN